MAQSAQRQPATVVRASREASRRLVRHALQRHPLEASRSEAVKRGMPTHQQAESPADAPQ
jgi:hypothetical protein